MHRNHYPHSNIWRTLQALEPPCYALSFWIWNCLAPYVCLQPFKDLERVGVISEDPKPPRWTHVSSPAEHQGVHRALPIPCRCVNRVASVQGEEIQEYLFVPFLFHSVRGIPKSLERNTVAFFYLLLCSLRLQSWWRLEAERNQDVRLHAIIWQVSSSNKVRV